MESGRDEQAITFGVQANVPLGQLAAVARVAERAGAARFLVADHPGTTSDPFVALAIAAAATHRIQLGTYVLNAGIREPWQVAAAAISLDCVSEGRFVLGIGAGHTPSEWQLAGLERPLPAARVSRLEEFVALASALLKGGPVTFEGDHFNCRTAQLDERGHELPFLIGGNGPRVLTLAAEHAQIVSFTGFGATQPDGHTHAVKWSEASVAETVALVTAAERARNPPPELEVLVQHVELTERREASARRFIHAAGVPGLDLDIALNTPFLLFGSPDQIAAQLQRWRHDHGITRFVARQDVLDPVAQIMRVLR